MTHTDSSRNLVIDVSYVAASQDRSMPRENLVLLIAHVRMILRASGAQTLLRTSAERQRQDLTGSRHSPDLSINEGLRVLAGLSTGFVQLLSQPKDSIYT